MEDNKIINLLFERAENALDEVSNKYSLLYRRIIREMVDDESDVEECENDLLMAIWNSIPPNRPESLIAYICKIARRIGIKKFKYNTRQKRDSRYTLMLSELGDCVGDANAYCEGNEDSETIKRVLSEFIYSLDAESRILFVRRYIYLESVASLAERFEKSENHISVKLFRTRKKLKKILEKEGIQV